MSHEESRSKLLNKLSPLIEGQVPEFVQADHPVFVDFLKDYFELEFSDFRERLNLNIEINNKTILKLITDVKRSTQNQLKNNSFNSKVGILE